MKTHNHKAKTHLASVRECAGVLLLAPFDPELVDGSENIIGITPALMAAIVTSRKGKSSLPKGGVRENESLEHAAMRETSEETGLMPDRLIGYLGSYERDELSRTGKCIGRVVVHVHLGFVANSLPLEPSADDVTEARWIDARKVPNEMAHPEAQAFLRMVLESYGIVVDRPISLAQKRHS